MKPYTLEAYKAGKKAKYRDGYYPLHIFYVPECGKFISVDRYGQSIHHTDANGVCWGQSSHEYDLIIDEPDEIREGWVNDYGNHFGGVYATLREGLDRMENRRINGQTWHLKFNLTQGTGTMEVVK